MTRAFMFENRLTIQLAVILELMKTLVTACQLASTVCDRVAKPLCAEENMIIALKEYSDFGKYSLMPSYNLY